MKLKAILFQLVLVLNLAACTEKQDDDTTTNPQQAATTGTWRVTLFTDSGKDETSDFTGYTFTFNTNNTVTAAKGDVTKSGTWQMSQSSNKYIIDLGEKNNDNKPLGELTDDWKIVSITANEIKLSDDNPASNEFLTFTKN